MARKYTVELTDEENDVLEAYAFLNGKKPTKFLRDAFRHAIDLMREDPGVIKLLKQRRRHRSGLTPVPSLDAQAGSEEREKTLENP